jgi:hypothetical protein
MTPQEQEDGKVRADLGALGRHVDHQLPYGWGFVVLAFPFGAGGRMNYVSNAQRSDIVRAMYEFIEATKGKWGEHEPEQSAAASDEQLGRARQRIAELEGILQPLLTRAADALEGWPRTRHDEKWIWPFEAHAKLIDELRKAAQ